MNAVIFAGGSGTRFWPISRDAFPKQFQPLIDGKSTLQLHVERLVGAYGWNHLYIQTTDSLATLVKSTFPELPLQNLNTEPVRRDVGPAVALAMLKLQRMGSGQNPVLMLWGDNVIEQEENFFAAVKLAEEMIRENGERLIFLGEKPQFANEQLGWIEVGKQVSESGELAVYERESFLYRPSKQQAEEWMQDGKHFWNPGYFLSTPDFLMAEFKRQQPEMYELLVRIGESIGTNREVEVIAELYPQLPSIHFDKAVLEGLPNSQTLIITGEYKWADPGTLYALKQYLQDSNEANVTKGKVFNMDGKDSLVYNFVDKQLVATIGLEGYIVVNTPDALFVCPKDDVGRIKELLEKFKDTDYQSLL